MNANEVIANIASEMGALKFTQRSCEFWSKRNDVIPPLFMLAQR